MTDPGQRASRLRELRPFADAAQQLRGWTLKYPPLPVGRPIPWHYEERAGQLAYDAPTVLDMGTGGGEVLSGILRGRRRTTGVVATEGWAPNVPVAGERLRSQNVAVVHTLNLQLPFASARFDLVLDRHEELSPAEVARVLRPGGRLLTQQVLSTYHAELRPFFPRMTVFEPHEITYPHGLDAAGLKIDLMDHHQMFVAYPKLGHLVYFLVAAPWTIPDFDLDADLEALLAVERELGGPDGIVLSDSRYLLEAHKPG